MKENYPPYFDVLPVHPPPEALESFTSYLTRLAEANKITSVLDLATICFPDQTLPTIRGFKDYLPISLGNSATVSVSSEHELHATTFFHLAMKFGRSALSPPSSNFLSVGLAKVLRYCPACLVKRPYYILPWRFTVLRGCIEHSCELLDRCYHCHRTIPIFASPLKVGICPKCKFDLCNSTAQPLTEQERQVAHSINKDLEFLLSPQPWELKTSPIAISLSRELTSLRQAQGLTQAQLSKQAGIPQHIIKSIENTSAPSANASFQRYLVYSSSVGTTLQQIFDKLVLQDSLNRENAEFREEISFEGEMLKKVQEILKALIDFGDLSLRFAFTS